MKHRCTQPQSGYPEFKCGAVATFRVRFIRKGSDKEVLATPVCGLHLAKAVRQASEHLHEDYPDVYVRTLTE